MADAAVRARTARPPRRNDVLPRRRGCFGGLLRQPSQRTSGRTSHCRWPSSCPTARPLGDVEAGRRSPRASLRRSVPLPVAAPPAPPHPGVARYLRRRRLRAVDRHALISDGLRALNALSTSTAAGLGCQYFAGGWNECAIAHRRREAWPLTAAQHSIVSHATGCVTLYGPRPADVPAHGALLELLRLPSVYEDQPLGLVEF